MSSSSTPSMSATFSFLFLLFTITPSYSARVLLDVFADPPQAFQHPTQPSMTFIMQDIQPSTINTLINSQQQQQQQQPFPFSKPLRNFPLTVGGIPLPYQTNPNDHNTPTQRVLDFPRFGIVFPATSTLQEELEFGLVTNIEENIYMKSSVYGPTLVGKAKGVYVAMSSSDNGNNHMMAMTVSFSVENGDDKSSEVDSLKFFGVHLRDVFECHVAVIGGTGKFKDANGYAVIKVVRRDEESTDIEGSNEEAKMMLMYNVFLG